MDDIPLVSPETYVVNLCKKRGFDRDEVTLSPTVILAMPLFMEIFKKWVERVEKTVIKNHYKNQDDTVSLVKARMGAPLMAMAVEEMVALGGLKFVHLGFAGSICKQLTMGDIVITRGALNETGIPPLYGFGDCLIPSDPFLTEELIEFAKKEDLKVYSGVHWCTDAPYKETWMKVKKYAEEGALCVEMEGAALFSVSKYYKVPAAAVYVITDVLEENGWQLTGHSKKVLEACKNVVNFMIAFAEDHHKG